jgi:hypothetical protein
VIGHLETKAIFLTTLSSQNVDEAEANIKQSFFGS